MHILHFFFHPDCTVGSGISPDQPKRLAGFTAGGEFHPALKIILILYTCFRCCQHLFFKRIPNLTKQQYLFARLCGLFLFLYLFLFALKAVHSLNNKEYNKRNYKEVYNRLYKFAVTYFRVLYALYCRGNCNL